MSHSPKTSTVRPNPLPPEPSVCSQHNAAQLWLERGQFLWCGSARTEHAGRGVGGWKETVETMQHSIDVSDDGIRASFFLKGWLGDLVHRREFAAGVAPCKTGTNSLVLFADVKVRYISLISPNSVVKEAGKGFRPGKPKLNARHCPIMGTVVLTTSS